MTSDPIGSHGLKRWMYKVLETLENVQNITFAFVLK